MIAAKAALIHVPWWLWALVAVGVVASVVGQQDRAKRKAQHRAYLRSPEWKGRRKDALVAAGGRCQDCGATRDLHVHHLTYKRHGRELPRDLRVLCARCHRGRHRGDHFDDRLDRLIGWARESFRH